MSKPNARQLATQAITRVLKNGESLTAGLAKAQEQASPNDKSLVAQLCYGTLRFEPKLSAILSVFIEKPLRAKDTDVRAALLIACYELLELARPAHAITNEYVALCDQINKRWAKGLMNAVLRQITLLADEPEQLDGLTEAFDRDTLIAFETAHPTWLAGMISKAWPDHADSIFAANNLQGPMSLRVNLSAQSRVQAITHLKEEGIVASASPLAKSAIVLDVPVDVNSIKGFDRGLFSVQDEAAQLAAELLPTNANDFVLDACAAPGGKTCALLEANSSLELIAADIDARRLLRVDENLERCQLTAATLVADISTDHMAGDRQFDAILADVPCSATGVVRRHPDIKQLRMPEDIGKLATLQRAILENLWPQLKSGGHLLYATCSTLPRENNKVIESFLNLHQDAKLMPICLSNGVDTGAGWQLFAGDLHNHDGFFYALLQKQ